MVGWTRLFSDVVTRAFIGAAAYVTPAAPRTQSEDRSEVGGRIGIGSTAYRPRGSSLPPHNGGGNGTRRPSQDDDILRNENLQDHGRGRGRSGGRGNGGQGAGK